MTYTTEQEKFWEGEFGNEYVKRNTGNNWIASNTAFFGRVLQRTSNIESVLEIGSSIGLNLVALKPLLPSALLSAVEINENAATQLKENLPDVDLHLTSVLDFQPTRKWDLVFSKGVLIHINPERLQLVYQLMYQCSLRYILVAEYYNPSPVGVSYRGQKDKLFKRDFVGEMMDRYPDISLVDYGFVYHRDPIFPQDDITWFLMEKARS